MVQAVVEATSGGSYDKALRDTFPGTTIHANVTECGRTTPGRHFIGSKAVIWEAGFDAAGGAYGYTCGTIGDLAAFAVDHLQDPEVGRVVDTGHPGQGYASGWRVTTENDKRATHWHTGTVPGYFSAIHLDPASGDGVVILMNASS
ncbi:serine hydrolase [Luteococcus sp. H91]|uniref:serine hydrolase n=1 Tax=Luteococcus sp. H91 TaxID=3139401 RepID=UPI00313E1679